MTFEERMSELGVDLSDLPEPSTLVSRSLHLHSKTYDFIKSLYGDSWSGADRTRLFLSYILYLVDIIDRMETRIVNLTGERDWLKSVLENHLFCETCVGGQGIEPCVNGHLCSTDNPNYRYSGVPEDWRVDNA